MSFFYLPFSLMIPKEDESSEKSTANKREESDSKSKSNNLFAAKYHSQAPYPKLVAGGESQEWWIKFKNTGLEIWENHNKNNKITKLALGTYSKPDMHDGREFQCDWESSTRLAVVEPATVKPGEIGNFVFKLKAPASSKPGKYKLYVTPKCPEGWLKHEDGSELNCYVEVEVIKKQRIDDIFTAEIFNQIKSQCQAEKSFSYSYSYTNSCGLADFVVPNADIKNVEWDRTECGRNEKLIININCNNEVPDASIVEVNIYSENTDIPLSLSNENLKGLVKNRNSQITINTDSLYEYKNKDLPNNFYVEAFLQNGDYIPAKSKFVKLKYQYAVQITSHIKDNIQYYAQRRFVYCWEKSKGENRWIARGILMTDDNGILFDMPKYVSDNSQLNELTDSTIDILKDGKWTSAKWNFFGEGEDLYAFQKWIGTFASLSSSIRNYDKKINFTPFVIKENDIFEYSFYIDTVDDKYICRFDDESDYFLMYCPPDIVGLSLFINYDSISLGNKNSVNNDTKYIVGFYSDKNYKNFMGEWNNSKCWYERVCNGNINDLWLEQTGNKIITKKGFLLNSGIFNGYKEIFNSPNNLRNLKIDSNPSYQSPSYHSPYIKDIKAIIPVKLPKTLEENLSILQSHTIFLDLHFKILIESTKNFVQTASKISEISDILELMKLYPGFKEYDYNDRFSYQERIYPSDDDKSKIEDALKYLNSTKDILIKAGFSDDNPVFRNKKNDILQYVRKIESFFENQNFLNQIKEWVTHIEKYEDAHASLKSPFIMRYTINGPYLYKVISESFCTILGIDFSINKGNDRTIGQQFYENHVLPFEIDLEKKYNKLEKKHNLSSLIKKIFKDYHLTPKEFSSEDIFTERTFNINNKDTSILKIIFFDTLFTKIVPNIWNNQIGIDSYITAITKLSTVYRSTMTFMQCQAGKLAPAYFHIKMIIARLHYHFSFSKNRIIKELMIAAEELAYRINNISSLNKAKQNINKAFSQKNLGKAPVIISRVISAIGIFITAYDMFQFYGKIQKSEEVTPTDLINLVRSIHSGCLAFTGLGVSKLIKINALKIIGEKAARILNVGTAVFFWYDAISYSMMALSDYEEGESVIATLRWVQAICAFGSALVLTVGLFISIPMVGLIVGFASVIAILAIDTYIMVEKYFRLGVENTVKELRKQLIKQPIFVGAIIVSDSDLKYIMKNVNTIVTYKDEFYKLDPHLIDKYTQYRDKIKELINDISYWNLDILKAGSVLYNKGYTIEEIAYICLEENEKILDHFKDELNHIKRFASMSLFEPNETINTFQQRTQKYSHWTTLKEYRNIEYSSVVEYGYKEKLIGGNYECMKVKST